jgi:hypothetical protein
MEEYQTLRLIEKAINTLPLESRRPGSAARDILREFERTSVDLRLQRKLGTASSIGIERNLKQIASKSATLLKLLKKADRNTFEAWAFEQFDHAKAKQDWLQLKVLLEASVERAASAAKAVSAINKQGPAPGKKGRPPDRQADMVTLVAANVYERLTGKTASREIGRGERDHKPRGPFHDFLAQVFQALSIHSSPDAANKRLQASRGRS